MDVTTQPPRPHPNRLRRPPPGPQCRADPSGHFGLSSGLERAEGGHSNPPAAVLLYRRTEHPLGRATSLCIFLSVGPGKPVLWCPEMIASHSAPNLTVPPVPRAPHRANDGLRRVAPLGPSLSPPASCPAHLARRRPCGQPAAPRTTTAARHRSHLWESSPDRHLPLPLIPCSKAKAASLRWIRGNAEPLLCVPPIRTYGPNHRPAR